MSRTARRTIAGVAAAALAVTALGAAPLTAQASSPAAVKAAEGDRVVQVLGINDFHGRINANRTEAGAAVLAGAVEELEASNPNTVFAAAGDLIGASTFESFIAQDKPTIDALNEAGLDVSAVGNHEFDKGFDDLKNRVMAPESAANPYGGAQWQYLGANVRNASDGSAALPESWTVEEDGVTIGFVGAVTDHLDELVSPAGIAGLDIEAPVEAANRVADDLKADGADVVVLLVHEGAASTDVASATDPGSDMGRIVNGADENIDAIVSGHTHLSYNHAIPVQEWIDEGRAVTDRPVVSAGQYGYNLNQLLFSVDDSDQLTGIEQNILPLVATVPPADPGGDPTYEPNYPADQTVATIVDQANKNADVLGAEELGEVAAPFNRAVLSNGNENRGGESTLGNLVAEVQRWATETEEAGSAQIAFMNPGGLRADMAGNASNGYPAPVTYKQAATVQPFANTLVNMNLTGAQIKAALEQQWQPAGASRPYLRLGASEGFRYTYDPDAASGSHITGMWLNDQPIDASASYSVTVNSFLAAGGDNFGAFAEGSDARDTGKIDLEAMVDYLAEQSSIAPDYAQQAVGVAFGAGAPAEYAPGDTVSFDLSSLVYSTEPDLKDTEVVVDLDGTDVGSFAVDPALGSTISDEYGTASVSFVVPAGTSSGSHTVTITGPTTGTTVEVPITVADEAPPAVTTKSKLKTTSHQYKRGWFIPPILFASVKQSDRGYPHGTFEIRDGDKVVANVRTLFGYGLYVLPRSVSKGKHTYTATFVPKSDDVGGSTSNPVKITVK